MITDRKTQVGRAKVSNLEVGKYYLVTELHNILRCDGNFRKACEDRVNKMQGVEFWRLLEALSLTFRANWVFWLVGNEAVTWSEEVIPIQSLTLTGISPKINEILASPEVDNNPLKFRNYLKSHPNTPDLEQFTTHKGEIVYPKILLREKDGKLLLLDGSHRLMSMVLSGEDGVTAFVARQSEPGKFRIGDSTIILLRELYRKQGASEYYKNSLLETVRLLIQQTPNARESVQQYWVEHVKDEEFKAVGRKLIEKQNV